MNIHKTILTTLAVLGMTPVGCTGTDDFSPCSDPEPFKVSMTLSEADSQQVLGPDWMGGDEVTDEMCTLICTDAFENTVGGIENGHVESIDSCQAAWFEAEDDTSGLSLDCEGTAVACHVMGRRPHDYTAPRKVPTDALAAFLVQAAHLEAASVVAFRQLAEQLERLGAPQSLIDRCLEAAEDEVLHTQLITELADARNISVPVVDEPQPREISLFEIARHNAIEGCVYETWAAMQAHVYAQTAADPKLRSAMARIAKDETRHGQLAWDLHHWFMGQVTAAQRLQITEEQAHALAELPQHARQESLGLPIELGSFPQPFETVARTFAQGLCA